MGCSHTNLYLFLLCYTAPSAPVLDVFYTSRTEHDLFLLLMRRFLIREADQDYIFLDTAQGNHYICIRQ